MSISSPPDSADNQDHEFGPIGKWSILVASTLAIGGITYGVGRFFGPVGLFLGTSAILDVPRLVTGFVRRDKKTLRKSGIGFAISAAAAGVVGLNINSFDSEIGNAVFRQTANEIAHGKTNSQICAIDRTGFKAFGYYVESSYFSRTGIDRQNCVGMKLVDRQGDYFTVAVKHNDSNEYIQKFGPSEPNIPQGYKDATPLPALGK